MLLVERLRNTPPGPGVGPYPMSAVRVFVAAGDDAARAGLEAVLRGRPDVEVAGGGPAPDGAGPLPDQAGPDVILWDLGAESLAHEWPAAPGAGGPPVIVLVADPAQAARALAGGVRGVLPRDVDSDTLAAAASAAAAGLVVLDPTLAAPVAGREPNLVEDLTPREHEVLQHLAEGLPNREIARRLGISEHTVKFHVGAILGKVGARSRTEAVAHAARLGLLIL